MTEQDCAQRISTAAQIAQTGQLHEAASICREVLSTNPNYVPALLWLVFSSTDASEMSQAINRARQLDPTNPLVNQAVSWYSQRQIQLESLRPTPSQPEPELNLGPPPAQGSKFTPLGEPVKDSAIFLFSQSGGLLVVTSVVLVCSIAVVAWLVSLILSRGMDGIRLTMLIGTALFALLCGAVVVYLLLDVITKPVLATGRIVGRHEIRREIRDRYGTFLGVDFFYEVDFVADDMYAKASAGSPVRLRMTEAQYQASLNHNRAFVAYGKRTGNVKLYQPIA